MAWQILAMWVIVIATIVWFVRDERRLRAEADLAQAARYYAHAPKYRYVAVTEPVAIPLPARRVGGLTPAQRTFLEDMTRKA